MTILCFSVGDKLANMLVNAGIVSFQKLEETNPRELELVSASYIR